MLWFNSEELIGTAENPTL